MTNILKLLLDKNKMKFINEFCSKFNTTSINLLSIIFKNRSYIKKRSEIYFKCICDLLRRVRLLMGVSLKN